MPKRPPYLEVAAAILAMAFLTLIVLGRIDTRPDVPSQLSMRSH